MAAPFVEVQPFFRMRGEVAITEELRLTSVIPPSVNHYLAYRAVMKRGKPCAMSYKTPEAAKYRKDFAAYVAAEAERQGWHKEVTKTQHYCVEAIPYFPRTDMDMSNYWKVMLDAITDTQLIWADDNVVCERTRRIYYDSLNPRIELVIRPVEYIGVFDNASQLDAFIADNCIGCVRYNRNCSILQKATEGRIQDAIHDGVCEKSKRVKGDKKDGERNKEGKENDLCQ